MHLGNYLLLKQRVIGENSKHFKIFAETTKSFVKETGFSMKLLLSDLCVCSKQGV